MRFRIRKYLAFSIVFKTVQSEPTLTRNNRIILIRQFSFGPIDINNSRPLSILLVKVLLLISGSLSHNIFVYLIVYFFIFFYLFIVWTQAINVILRITKLFTIVAFPAIIFFFLSLSWVYLLWQFVQPIELEVIL